MIDYEDLILQKQEMIEIWEMNLTAQNVQLVTVGGMISRRRNLYVNILK